MIAAAPGQNRSSHRPDHEVIIIGAGLGGIGMAVRLKTLDCQDFLILEKASGPGGTWRENHYPGSGCDIPSHLYSFSFAQNPLWSRVFSRQPEILAYIEDVVAQHGLHDHIRYNSDVASATWDEMAGHWRVCLASGDTLSARTVVGAWGQLNRPAIPAFPGAERFRGKSFHSAAWRHDIDLRGMRVATVGSGASAVQFVPPVADAAAQLTLFQRTPNYIVPRLDREYTPEELDTYRQNPQQLQESRDALYWDREHRFAKMRLGSANAEEVKTIALQYLHSQIQDPDLRAKLTPDYPVGCKRILVSDDFYASLNRPNVELVTEPIVQIEENGIRAGGRLHEADVIIYATGFETQSFLGAGDIVGRQGRSLRDTWSDAPSAYLGMQVPDFPNFFLLYGPNTNLGHNSIISMLEIQIDYVAHGVRALRDSPDTALDVSTETLQEYDSWLQRALAGSSWSGSCRSWYKAADGRIVANWPGTVEEYRAMVAQHLPQADAADSSDHQDLRVLQEVSQEDNP